MRKAEQSAVRCTPHADAASNCLLREPHAKPVLIFQIPRCGCHVVARTPLCRRNEPLSMLRSLHVLVTDTRVSLVQLGRTFSGPKHMDENYIKGQHILQTVGFSVRMLCGAHNLMPMPKTSPRAVFAASITIVEQSHHQLMPECQTYMPVCAADGMIDSLLQQYQRKLKKGLLTDNTIMLWNNECVTPTHHVTTCSVNNPPTCCSFLPNDTALVGMQCRRQLVRTAARCLPSICSPSAVNTCTARC